MKSAAKFAPVLMAEMSPWPVFAERIASLTNSVAGIAIPKLAEVPSPPIPARGQATATRTEFDTPTNNASTD